MSSKIWRALSAAALGGLLNTAEKAAGAASDLVITTIVGSSPTSQYAHLNGSFYSPTGIAADSAGNMYVAEPDNVIYKVSPTGTFQVFAGQIGVSGSSDGPGSAASFNGPNGLAIDASNNLYVADSLNSTIRKITPSGVVSTLAGKPRVLGSQDGPSAIATLSYPWGLAIDTQGNLYAAEDSGSKLVRKISPDGTVSTLASIPGSGQLSPGITVDAAGNVYVAEISAPGIPEDPPAPANYIYKVSPSGSVSLFAGQSASGLTDGTGTAAQFSGAWGLAIEPSGNILAADGRRIREITPAGAVTSVAGLNQLIQSPSDIDGSGAQAQFSNLSGIAVDHYGNAFVITNSGALRRGIRATNSQSPARLLNLSALATVAPGAPFSSGLVVQGPASETLLIRAVGPTLQQFGVAGPLSNPQLTLYTQGGTRVASTADGKNATNVLSAGNIVGAFPLPAQGADAALVITLGPGVYSAQVSSSTAASGQVLLEVYEVP